MVGMPGQTKMDDGGHYDPPPLKQHSMAIALILVLPQPPLILCSNTSAASMVGLIHDLMILTTWMQGKVPRNSYWIVINNFDIFTCKKDLKLRVCCLDWDKVFGYDVENTIMTRSISI